MVVRFLPLAEKLFGVTCNPVTRRLVDDGTARVDGAITGASSPDRLTMERQAAIEALSVISVFRCRVESNGVPNSAPLLAK
jgi:hypothetical protein